MLRFRLHDIERSRRGGGGAGTDGGAEQGLLGIGAEVFDELAGAGDKPPGAGE